MLLLHPAVSRSYLVLAGSLLLSLAVETAVVVVVAAVAAAVVAAVVSVLVAFLSVDIVVTVVAAVDAAAAAAAEDSETFGSNVDWSVYFADIRPIPSSGTVRDLDDLVY